MGPLPTLDARDFVDASGTSVPIEMLFASKFSPRQKKNDKREFLRVSSK